MRQVERNGGRATRRGSGRAVARRCDARGGDAGFNGRTGARRSHERRGPARASARHPLVESNPQRLVGERRFEPIHHPELVVELSHVEGILRRRVCEEHDRQIQIARTLMHRCTVVNEVLAVYECQRDGVTRCPEDLDGLLRAARAMDIERKGREPESYVCGGSPREHLLHAGSECRVALDDEYLKRTLRLFDDPGSDPRLEPP
eukprot:6359666-Prymnesium_polylepis.2